MGAVAGRDKTLGIEHQRFVRAGLGRLDACGDAIELAVRIELLVLHRRVAAPDMDGEQADAILDRAWQSLLIFRDDHDRRRGYHHPRVLIRRRADTACHHQANVHAFLIGHAVAADRLVEPFDQCVPRDADIHRDRL